MSERRIGVALSGSNAAALLGQIERAEQAGIQAVWRTNQIMFGTSIVPTFPRHPLVMVQQVQVVAQLAPGRFRLGVGPSHRPSMEAMGIQFSSPLGHLREYLRI